MKVSEKGKSNTWDMDLRVRDRNIHNGMLDPKQVERHLAELPDLDSQCETIEEPQPALGGDGEG